MDKLRKKWSSSSKKIIKEAKAQKRKFLKEVRKVDHRIKHIRDLHKAIKYFELIILGLFLGVVFLSFELALRIYDLYAVAYWVDVPSHFFGGMAIASISIIFFYLIKTKKKNFWVTFSVFIISIIWEIMETIDEYINPDQPWYLKDFFIWDGFFDIIFTLAGGITFLVLFNLYIKKNLGGKLLKLK